MGAASVIEGLAAWRGARWAAAAAAVLLAAVPSLARAEPGDTVRVEWAASANGSLVILNAYAVRGGKPVPESVRGLLIERDPAALPDTAKHRHPFANRESAYASAEGALFLRGLGFSETTLDALANDGGSSQATDQFDVQEWSRLLNQLFEKKEIVEGPHRVIIQEVAVPVQGVFADELNALFSGNDNTPVLPHLRSGRIALARGQQHGARTDSIDFGSIALQERTVIQRYLKNYGTRPVETELSFSDSDPDAEAAFSAEGVQRLEVPPGDSVPVSLVFAPKQSGPQVDTLDFLVDGARAAQVILTGSGMSTPGIVARVLEWIAARAALLAGLLAFTLAVVIGRKRGVTLGLPWRREPPIPLPDPPGATLNSSWDRGPTPPTLDPSGTEPRPHDPFASMPKPPAGRPGDAAVRQRLVAARNEIDEALAELGGSVPPTGGSRAADLRRLRELERERESFIEAQPLLEERIRTLTEAQEAVRAENNTLRAEKAAAQETLATLRGEVNRLYGEREKLALRLRAVAEVLELSDEMVSDAGWPETQRLLPELGDGGKPRYLWNFEQMVADLTAIFEEIGLQAGEGRLAAAVNAVLGGSNNNAGLRMVATELERKSLVSHLGLGHPRELRTLGADRFYRDFVDRRFRPIIDNIAKLGLYARSRSPEFGMGQRLTREGVDPALLERALALIETRMRADFGVEVDTVRLFEERFDRSRHDTASHSTLRHTLPDLEASIRRLPSETIYDITSVGLRSDGLGVSVRPVVAWVASQ